MSRADTDGASLGWIHTGRQRPAHAAPPAPGQESVWDYPRPPRLAADHREIVVRAGAVEVARSRRTVRLLETASPPSFYVPLEDVTPGVLVAVSGTSRCEWKGEASYWSVVVPGGRVERAAWSYQRPAEAFAAVRGHVAFYASLLECFVDGERVRPQPGRFYGGWITNDVVGPFKGEADSAGW